MSPWPGEAPIPPCHPWDRNRTLPLTILLTNIVLARRSGTEVVTEQLADALRVRGHRPVIFTPQPGLLAQQMRMRGHMVVDRPAALPWRPDIIHAHHTGPAMAALAAHPGVPAIFVSHDASAPFDAAPPHPRVARILAVDERCRARLVGDGIAPGEIGLLPNGIDLGRIPPRQHPLPERPRRALALTKHAEHLPALRQACAAHGIELEELGHGPGRMSDTPEAAFAAADLVFATARSALEAAAAGAGVVVCDARGCAGFLSRQRVEAWLPWNLGAALLKEPTTAVTVTAAIAEWSAPEAAAAASLVRQERNLDALMDRIEAIYEEVLRAPPAGDLAAEAAATGAFIAGWVPNFDQAAPWRTLAESICQLSQGDGAAAITAGIGHLSSQIDGLGVGVDALAHRHHALEVAVAALQQGIATGASPGAAPPAAVQRPLWRQVSGPVRAGMARWRAWRERRGKGPVQGP